MDWPIVEESASCLAEYGRLPITFRVDRILEVSEVAGGLALAERAVKRPYVKDYDAIEGNAPTDWAAGWDLANWGFLSVFSRGRRIAGAVLAAGTQGLEMLEGRDDLAVLWDLRVHPDFRRRGLGSRLFRASEEWAEARGCRQIKVETQNINVPACRFYAGQGCVLGAIRRFAYPDFPDEVQLLWYKDLEIALIKR